MPSANNVLSDCDINARLVVSADTKEQPKSMEYHRKMLESKLKSGQAQQQYVSPSDGIQSPATQKLAAFKNKHAMGNAKPKTLFAMASSKNIEAAKGTAMFADLPIADRTTNENFA